MASTEPLPICAVSVGSPDGPPSEGTVHGAAVLHQASAPQSTARVGAALSMPIESVRQSDALPARSITRLTSVCGPSAVMDTPGVVTTVGPSSLYSMRSMPEPGVASVPVTVVEKLVLIHGVLGRTVV